MHSLKRSALEMEAESETKAELEKNAESETKAELEKNAESETNTEIRAEFKKALDAVKVSFEEALGKMKVTVWKR